MSEQLTLQAAKRICEAGDLTHDYVYQLAAELEAKTKECEELRRLSWFSKYHAAQSEIVQLRQQVEELKRERSEIISLRGLGDRDHWKSRAEKAEQDSARLDWLQQGHSALALSQSHLGKQNPMFETINGGLPFQNESLRQAIDDARA